MGTTENQNVAFTCNICGSSNEVEISRLTREEASCSSCGSSVRMRSLIHVLTSELFGRSLTIAEIDPPRPDIVGIGMSCWDGYANRLAHRIAFKNTFYHQEPRVDITNVPEEMLGTLDFIVSSDVFEHVAPPVDRAFINARKLLKPGGVFVFTVPFAFPDEPNVLTTEHFPGLHDFTIIEDIDSSKYLRNVRKDGAVQYFYNLVWHGGPGETLEMRRFSEWSLIEELKAAGFNEITIHRNDYLKAGIHWSYKGSVPISARVVKKGWRGGVTINIR